MPEIDVYWIGGPRWIPTLKTLTLNDLRRPDHLRWLRDRIRRGRQPWQKRWQAEWPGCQRAVRGWTYNGTVRRALKATT